MHELSSDDNHLCTIAGFVYSLDTSGSKRQKVRVCNFYTVSTRWSAGSVVDCLRLVCNVEWLIHSEGGREYNTALYCRVCLIIANDWIISLIHLRIFQAFYCSWVFRITAPNRLFWIIVLKTVLLFKFISSTRAYCINLYTGIFDT